MLALDLLSRGDRALERAIELASRWRAELHVVNALENELLPEPYRKREIAERQAEAKALLAPLIKRSMKTQVHIVVGGAASAVIETARAMHASLLVMAPAGHTTLTTVVLGSTVERVLRHADQPVLVVKRRCEGAYRSIVVVVDLCSDNSALALRQALRLFPGAQVTVVHAVETPFSAFSAAGAVAAKVQTLHTKEVAALVARKAAALDGIRRPKIKVVIGPGSADNVLARELGAIAPDLVVLGTHGLTGVRRAVIGSTAERLIETLPCDVLAIRPPS